jgi:hypothetical protein
MIKLLGETSRRAIEKGRRTEEQLSQIPTEHEQLPDQASRQAVAITHGLAREAMTRLLLAVRPFLTITGII